MKKGLIIVLAVVVAVVLVVAIVWMRDDGDNNASTTNTSTNETSENEQGAANDTENSEQLVIEYDGSGFTPSTLTVKSGDAVTFVNESSTLVWPASDDHPTHTNLSGFDALKGLGEGEEYSFTFNEVGEWGYHNHLNSGQGGTIVVE